MALTPRQNHSPLTPLVLLAAVALLSGCDGHRPVEPTSVVGVSGAVTAVAPSLRAPSAVTATVISYDRIFVTWLDNSGNEDGFEVHLSSTGDPGTFALRATVRANLKEHVEVTQPSTQYCYRVRAVRTIGKGLSFSEFSNVSCATTPQAPPPPPPPPPPLPDPAGSLDVMPYLSTAVQMRWGSSRKEDGFRIERSTDGATSWSSVATVPSTSTDHLYYDYGLTSEQRVCYRVIAFNAAGDAEPSNVDCTTPPRAPTNLVGTLRADGAVDLTWTDNSTVEDGYEVWALIGSWVCYGWDPCYWVVDDYQVGDLAANTTSYRCPAESCGGAGSLIHVKARKDSGYSDDSNYVQVR